MDKHTCETKCMNNYEHSKCSDGGVKGFRIDQHCSQGKVGLLIVKDNKYDKTKRYACPSGWHWAKWVEYEHYEHSQGCKGNNNKATQGKHAMYNRCGFNNYHPPKAGGGYSSASKYAFIFADSHINNRYQHGGNYMGYTNTNIPVNNMGGIVCMIGDLKAQYDKLEKEVVWGVNTHDQIYTRAGTGGSWVHI